MLLLTDYWGSLRSRYRLTVRVPPLPSGQLRYFRRSCHLYVPTTLVKCKGMFAPRQTDNLDLKRRRGLVYVRCLWLHLWGLGYCVF